jgi:putative NADPH-quinone reductase
VLNLVVVGWPHGELEALAYHRVVSAARAVGHSVTAIDLTEASFTGAMPRRERADYHGESVVPAPELVDSVAAVRAAEALVFVYPTMATGVPPVLRGWLERVMLPGVAFVFNEAGRVRPGLKHVRRIVGIATYPHSWTVTKLEHDNGYRLLARALRLNTGLRTRVRWAGCYDRDHADSITRARFLARAEAIVTSL